MGNVDTFDKQLLFQLQSNSPTAFEEIYRAYVEVMLDYAAQRLSSLEEARDLVHDVFLNFYERRRELAIKTSLKAYLFTALKYKIIDHIRKNIHKEYYADMLTSLPLKAENNAFSEMVCKDLNAIIDKEVGQLPPRAREIFLLSRKNQLSITEIAGVLNLSEQTVKNQLTTALKKLRPVLEQALLIGIFLS